MQLLRNQRGILLHQKEQGQRDDTADEMTGGSDSRVSSVPLMTWLGVGTVGLGHLYFFSYLFKSFCKRQTIQTTVSQVDEVVAGDPLSPSQAEAFFSAGDGARNDFVENRSGSFGLHINKIHVTWIPDDKDV